MWENVRKRVKCLFYRLGIYIEWKGNLEVENCDIACAWKLGELKAIKLLNLQNNYFIDLNGSGVTMLRPYKRLIGVNVDTERNELDDEHNTSEADTNEIEDNLASLEIEELIEEENVIITTSTTVELDGKNVHKASVVKELLNNDANVSSTERLRRVGEYSKNVGIQETIGSDDDVDIDECVMLSDTLSAKVQIDAGLVAFCIFKVNQ